MLFRGKFIKSKCKKKKINLVSIEQQNNNNVKKKKKINQTYTGKSEFLDFLPYKSGVKARNDILNNARIVYFQCKKLLLYSLLRWLFFWKML